MTKRMKQKKKKYPKKNSRWLNCPRQAASQQRTWTWTLYKLMQNPLIHSLTHTPRVTEMTYPAWLNATFITAIKNLVRKVHKEKKGIQKKNANCIEMTTMRSTREQQIGKQKHP